MNEKEIAEYEKQLDYPHRGLEAQIGLAALRALRATRAELKTETKALERAVESISGCCPIDLKNVKIPEWCFVKTNEGCQYDKRDIKACLFKYFRGEK